MSVKIKGNATKVLGKKEETIKTRILTLVTSLTC